MNSLFNTGFSCGTAWDRGSDVAKPLRAETTPFFASVCATDVLDDDGANARAAGITEAQERANDMVGGWREEEEETVDCDYEFWCGPWRELTLTKISTHNLSLPGRPGRCQYGHRAEAESPVHTDRGQSTEVHFSGVPLGKWYSGKYKLPSNFTSKWYMGKCQFKLYRQSEYIHAKIAAQCQCSSSNEGNSSSPTNYSLHNQKPRAYRSCLVQRGDVIIGQF